MSVLSSFNLDEKKVIVTGGASGLGKAMGIALAEVGADVAIVDTNIEGAQIVVDEIKKLGRTSFSVETDITNPEQVKQIVETTMNRWGRIDILVNSAGIGEASIPPEELSEENWNSVINVNLTGTFWCCREIGKVMIKQKRGKIINVSSICGSIVAKGQAGLSAYSASKGGVILLTKVLAARWAKHNINVNCISPGYMRTPMSKAVLSDPDTCQMIVELVPMGRIGNPRDLAGAVVFLSSDASNFITGHDLVVDGGATVW